MSQEQEETKNQLIYSLGQLSLEQIGLMKDVLNALEDNQKMMDSIKEAKPTESKIRALFCKYCICSSCVKK